MTLADDLRALRPKSDDHYATADFRLDAMIRIWPALADAVEAVGFPQCVDESPAGRIVQCRVCDEEWIKGKDDPLHAYNCKLAALQQAMEDTNG